MGYETDRFVTNDIEEEFICCICQDVIQDPVMLSTCEHVFCGGCIRKWMIEMERTCPVDRGRFQIRDLRPPQRPFLNLLGNLKIRCDFAKSGCSEVLKLDNLMTHCANCYFNPSLKKECRSGCGAVLSGNDKLTHNCIEYLKAKCSMTSDSAKDKLIEDLQKQIEELKDFFDGVVKFLLVCLVIAILL